MNRMLDLRQILIMLPEIVLIPTSSKFSKNILFKSVTTIFKIFVLKCKILWLLKQNFVVVRETDRFMLNVIPLIRLHCIVYAIPIPIKYYIKYRRNCQRSKFELESFKKDYAEKNVNPFQTCCGFVWLDGQGQWIKPSQPFDVWCLLNFSSDQNFVHLQPGLKPSSSSSPANKCTQHQMR